MIDNDNIPPRWEFTLSQFIEKEHDNAPDFTGEAQIGTNLYDAAAWFGEISKGRTQGRPYLGLQLTSKTNAATQKVTVSLWEKANRVSPEDPHFKTREELNGQDLKFAAWIEPAGELFRLRVLIEPFTAASSDLSEAARLTHARLKDFTEKASLRLSDKPAVALPAASSPATTTAAKTLKLKTKAPKTDPDLDAEPNSIPF